MTNLWKFCENFHIGITFPKGGYGRNHRVPRVVMVLTSPSLGIVEPGWEGKGSVNNDV